MTHPSVGAVLKAAGVYTPPVLGAVSRDAGVRLGEMISVRDFGAVGDDTTDDSAAFQAAMDTGRAIYVPNATYRIVQGLKIRDGLPVASPYQATQCILIGETGGLIGNGPLGVSRPRLRYDPVTPGTDEPLLTRERGYLQANQTPNFTHTGGVSTAGSVSVILKNLISIFL